MFFLTLVSAVSTTPQQVTLSNDNPNQLLEFSGLNGSTTLSLSTSISAYTELNFYNVDETNKWVTISLKPNVPEGNYIGSINYNEGMTPIGINIEANETEIFDTDIMVFPTSKVVTVKQGSEKTQNIIITVPDNYPRSITIQSVDFNPGTETILFGDLNLGQIVPGGSVQIPITFSGVDAQTGSYYTQLSVFATDSEGQVKLPSISLTLQVTAGVTPVTGDTFSTAPNCALSATALNLNNTYTFTCSGVVSNLEINIPSSEFYIGKNVEISSGIYRYDFMPTQYGLTSFNADFRYNGASIFTPFNQELRISSAGSLVAGTDLKFLFTPKLDAVTGEEESFLIQLADNKTGSLVEGPRLFIDATEINRTGSFSFEFDFESNKDYELRGKATGYEDIVDTINIKPDKIEIRMTPATGDTSTMFNITTSVENATLTIQDKEYIDFYYGALPGGSVEIKARKDGYKTEIVNFTIDDRPKILSFGAEFEKGKEQNFTISKEGDWVVYYRKTMDATERTEYARGTGSLVKFTPEKNGAYVVEVDGIHVGTFEAPGFSFSNKWWFAPAWVWIILGIVLCIIIFIVIARNSQSNDPQANDGGNLTFGVGGD